MSGFDPGWLALREPFDRAARAASAAQLNWPAFAARLHAGHDAGAPLGILDLGCGTGANLRELAPRLGGRQHWRLVDHDPQLLQALPDALARWALAHGWRCLRAAQGLSIAGGGFDLEVVWARADLMVDFDRLPVAGAQLVTACALLDLVSAPWLERLVTRCRAVGAAVCFALNVDDRVRWQPGDPDDGLVHTLFRAHQGRDKGFGPAMGGTAAWIARAALQRAGYRCLTATSDWAVSGHEGPNDLAMLREMVDGMAGAAIAQAPRQAGAVRDWQLRRLAQIADPALHPRLGLTVGHADLLGWLD